MLAAPDADGDLLSYAFVPSLALPLILAYPVWKSDRATATGVAMAVEPV